MKKLNSIYDNLMKCNYLKSDIYHSLRKVLMGNKQGANISELINVIGMKEIIKRINENL